MCSLNRTSAHSKARPDVKTHESLSYENYFALFYKFYRLFERSQILDKLLEDWNLKWATFHYHELQWFLNKIEYHIDIYTMYSYIWLYRISIFFITRRRPIFFLFLPIHSAFIITKQGTRTWILFIIVWRQYLSFIELSRDIFNHLLARVDT